MRRTEFWRRMEEALGAGYAEVWASQYVLADLDGRTVDEALADGYGAKEVWEAVWAARELPPNLR